MCKTRAIKKELKKTVVELETARQEANYPLESPACYALPLTAFVLGFALQKRLPNPIKIIALLGRL